MKSQEPLEQTLRRLGERRRETASTGPAVDERIRADAHACLAEHSRAPSPDLDGWDEAGPSSLLQRRRPLRLALKAAAAALILVAAGIWLADRLAAPAWAIEEAIEALSKYRAVHMAGEGSEAGGPSGPVEIWARANETATQSEACLMRADDVVVWVEDGRTYFYLADQNKVLVEYGVTAGVRPWYGASLLELLSKAPDSRTSRGIDPSTGRKRVMLTGSMESALGPQSWRIEFDEASKLPVSLRQWNNLKRRGRPQFAVERITYFDDLPDSDLVFAPPPGVVYETKPLAIPETSLPALAGDRFGIPVAGLSHEEACREILGQLWDAAIRDDLDRIRQLCPLLAKWDDAFLQAAILDEESVTAVLQIGSIEQMGTSAMGPLAMVPSRLRCRDGRVREVRVIVQFRDGGPGPSCVVHGPHGNSIEIE